MCLLDTSALVLKYPEDTSALVPKYPEDTSALVPKCPRSSVPSRAVVWTPIRPGNAARGERIFREIC